MLSILVEPRWSHQTVMSHWFWRQIIKAYCVFREDNHGKILGRSERADGFLDRVQPIWDRVELFRWIESTTSRKPRPCANYSNRTVKLPSDDLKACIGFASSFSRLQGWQRTMKESGKALTDNRAAVEAVMLGSASFLPKTISYQSMLRGSIL